MHITCIISYTSINIHFMNVCVQHNSTKGYTRLAVARDKVYQLLANGRWFSPGTPASSTTKIGRHDIDEILLKVTLSTINGCTSYKISCIMYIQSNIVVSISKVESVWFKMRSSNRATLYIRFSYLLRHW
jgi:hypothetical protein